MSELNTYYIPTRSGNSCLCYLKSEADKVIAELKRNVDNWTDSYEISRKINAELEAENRKLKRALWIALKNIKPNSRDGDYILHLITKRV